MASKRRIKSLFLQAGSGGVGTANSMSFLADGERTIITDLGPEVEIVLKPPKSLPMASGRAVVHVYVVPKSVIRYMEVEPEPEPT